MWTTSKTAAALVFCTLAGLPAAALSAETQRVRGTIESLDGSVLLVKSREGPALSIALNSDWTVSSVAKAAMSDIKPGDYIGTASVPKGDNGAEALEVLIFPAAMKGTGEGSFAWDLAPNSTMTNATVANAVTGVDGQKLVLSYKGNEKTVVIPDGTPIVTFAPAQKTDMVPGAPIFISAQRDDAGKLSAGRVVVGTKGVAPPM
ncbi:hypothetical protein [Microvirga antarctica]|uniref:hypothetical protein n=1 Tax=Microvirga antarctica TaxID=2819233 RepID=UPI001B30AE59|nr:hypothetical protein [Microvirga antarctica]